MDFEQFRGLVEQSLAEDIGSGDITTRALIPAGEKARAAIVARQRLVTAGLPLARMIFLKLDPDLTSLIRVDEGEKVESGTVLIELEGSASAILTGERTALNLLQRLCGIATLTSRFVAAAGVSVEILDTRKTLPGFRKLEKYAVKQGGGTNHRFGLYDSILVKDNHLAVVERFGAGRIRKAVNDCRRAFPEKEIEIEVENLEELEEALAAAADIILLDNFTLDELAEAVIRTGGKALLEASGGVDLDTIEAIARTGVDRISVGALTHSVPAADIALTIEPPFVH